MHAMETAIVVELSARSRIRTRRAVLYYAGVSGYWNGHKKYYRDSVKYKWLNSFRGVSKYYTIFSWCGSQHLQGGTKLFSQKNLQYSIIVLKWDLTGSTTIG